MKLYSNKVLPQTKTSIAVASLQFTHHWLLTKVRKDLSEEQWFELMLDYGLKFAKQTANLYPKELQQKVVDILIKTPPKINEPYNWFWMWWKLQWMQDDFHFIDQKIYQLQTFSYEYYKNIMLECSMLEMDLLNQLQSH